MRHARQRTARRSPGAAVIATAINDEWVPTRRVWTQHSYHVTNATSDGNVPLAELDNWTSAGLNNYRQNVQGEGIFNAPDLTVDLSVALDLCAEGKLRLLARVANAGALGVGAGIEVVFYEEDATGGPAARLGSAKTTEALLPGASTVVSLAVAEPEAQTAYAVNVDGESASAGVVIECDESNNSDRTSSVECHVVK